MEIVLISKTHLATPVGKLKQIPYSLLTSIIVINLYNFRYSAPAWTYRRAVTYRCATLTRCGVRKLGAITSPIGSSSAPAKGALTLPSSEPCTALSSVGRSKF